MKVSLCVPRRIGPEETAVIHISLASGALDETRAAITVELTPTFIQELREAADKAEDVLNQNTNAKRVQAKFKEFMDAEGVA